MAMPRRAYRKRGAAEAVIEERDESQQAEGPRLSASEREVHVHELSSARPDMDAGQCKAFLADWDNTGQCHLLASSADYYFNSYSHYGVHEEMLKDYVTTNAYIDAIRHNSHLFRGRIVLDVGCGLGALSLLAAEAGAKRVIGVELQQELVNMATSVARKNGYGPEVVQFICGTVSSISELPDGIEQVDILVSDFMGYFLFYDSRINDLLKARDKWLRPGGMIFPDKASLNVALLDDAPYRCMHFEYFNSVWEFDFSPMKAAAASEPVVSIFEAENILSHTQRVQELDLCSCPASAASSFAASFELRCKRQGRVHACVAWFDIGFSFCHKYVSFTTSPSATETCWKQTAFFLSKTSLPVRASDKVHGMIAMRKPFEDRRQLEVKLSVRVGKSGKPVVEHYQWT